jgi:hypothetical protein
MIKLFDLLKEIGDASLAVPYKKTTDQSNKFGHFLSWEFKIGEDTYIVNSEIDDEDGEMSVEFRLSTAGITTRTNKGDQYKIIATIINILKDYTQKHPEIVKISYFPAKSFEDDDQREKLYKIYFDKNFPNWKYTNDEGEIHIEKPKSSVISKIKSFFK